MCAAAAIISSPVTLLMIGNWLAGDTSYIRTYSVVI